MADQDLKNKYQPVADFMSRAVTALTHAGERVKAKYGMYCTSAAAQIHALQQTGSRYEGGDVTVIAMKPGREAL